MNSSALCSHEARRHQGYPAISVLRGPVGVGLSSWRTWCEANGRTCVVTQGIDPSRWVEGYIDAFLWNDDPVRIAKQSLANHLSIPWESLSPSRLTSSQLARLFDQAGFTESRADRLRRRLLEFELQGEPVSTDAVFQWFCNDPEGEPWITTIGAIVDFLPRGASPALLVVPTNVLSDSNHDAAILEQAAQQLAVLISHVPLASVGLCVSDASFEHYLNSAPESFSKAVLRESLVSVSGLSTGEITETLTQRLRRSVSKWTEPIEQLAARCASPELVERFVDVVLEFEEAERAEERAGGEISEPPHAENPRTTQEPDAARSSAERFLHALLESTPDLAGLFELNIKPGFDFGGRPAEIDLACLSKRIAVEIDGYHHFTDSAAYRRDRRKDVLLQEHGYFVLRFLAEDVVSQMEFICDSIRTVVNLRA